MLATAGLMALAASIGRSHGRRPAARPSTAGLDRARGRAASSSSPARCGARSAALGGLAAGPLLRRRRRHQQGDADRAPPPPGALRRCSLRPFLYATAGAHGLGFVVIQRAFQHGGPIASLGPMTAAANLLPMAAGVAAAGRATAVRRSRPRSAHRRIRRGRGGRLGAGRARRALRSEETPLEPAPWAQPSLPTAAR